MRPAQETMPDRVPISGPPCAAAPATEQGSAHDLLALLGAPGHEPERERSIGVEFRRLSARAVLFDEGTPAEAIHVVRTGTFKCCRGAVDSGDAVLGFARRGDVLGYGALALGRYTSAAVALESSSVAVVPLADLPTWLQLLPALGHALHQALSLQHARAEELSDVRAPVPADVRLARFLLHWSHRMAASGHAMRQLRLAMTRREIARLLGVTHETVSRSFAALAERGCVAVSCRTVDILDADGLLDAARARAVRRRRSVRSREGHRVHRLPSPQ